MSGRASYEPGEPYANVEKQGAEWVLVLTRELRHPPPKVWEALTDPAHLREWSPFDSDRNLGSVGSAMLTTVGAPAPRVTEAQVKRADAPNELEYNWGGFDVRWQLEPLGATGTRLTLWTNIDRRFIAMGAAGWHVCLDVLDRMLSGDPIGRIVGPEATRLDGWRRLNAEYAKRFGLDTTSRGFTS